MIFPKQLYQMGIISINVASSDVVRDDLATLNVLRHYNLDCSLLNIKGLHPN